MLETSVLPADVRDRITLQWESFWACRQALGQARRAGEDAAAAHLLLAARTARTDVIDACARHLDMVRGLLVVRVSDFAWTHGVGGLVLAARRDTVVVPAVVRPGALDNAHPLLRTVAADVVCDIPPAALASIAWSMGAGKETVMVTSHGIRGVA